MNVKKNKYPSFWKTIHRDFKDKNINYDLICPMNYLYNLKLDQGVLYSRFRRYVSTHKN